MILYVNRHEVTECKQGKWKYAVSNHQIAPYRYLVCSECGYEDHKSLFLKTCPNCKIKMLSAEGEMK